MRWSAIGEEEVIATMVSGGGSGIRKTLLPVHKSTGDHGFSLMKDWERRRLVASPVWLFVSKSQYFSKNIQESWI
ncbi:MAG: hypothetical protein ACLTT1_03110 [[Clostridium] scindens]